MTERFVLGVDIGLSGAVAVVDATTEELVAVYDMPCLDGAGPAGRRAICAPLLVDVVFKSHAVRAFVDRIGARPGEGPAGAFAFGHSAGIVAGILASAAIPATLLTPPQWKRLVGLTPGRDGAKDRSRAEAIRRWPDKAAWFALKKWDGRADGLPHRDRRSAAGGPVMLMKSSERMRNLLAKRRIAPKADTLASLDLSERPGQKITWIYHVPHSREDQRVDVVYPGDVVFSCGHHGAYAYTVAIPQTQQGKATR